MTDLRSLAPRFAALLARLDRVHGSCVLDGTLRDDGKREGRGVTNRLPPPWNFGSAISPGSNPSVCRSARTKHAFGPQSILTRVDFDLVALMRRIVDAELPLVLRRSKSGGVHCRLFAASSSQRN
jgi:hypothetical protein